MTIQTLQKIQTFTKQYKTVKTLQKIKTLKKYRICILVRAELIIATWQGGHRYSCQIQYKYEIWRKKRYRRKVQKSAQI